MLRRPIPRKRDRPCKLEVDHIVFIQTPLDLLDKTTFPALILPQKNLAEVDGTVDLPQHLMELLRLVGIVYNNHMFKVREGLFLNGPG
jgi:hypothetical protein